MKQKDTLWSGNTSSLPLEVNTGSLHFLAEAKTFVVAMPCNALINVNTSFCLSTSDVMFSFILAAHCQAVKMLYLRYDYVSILKHKLVKGAILQPARK